MPRRKQQPTQIHSLESRPAWDGRPRRNPPSPLRGLAPRTYEPWTSVQIADNGERMAFARLGDGYELVAPNGLIDAAKDRKKNTWNSSPVRYMPPSLRGQTEARAEPWSEYHNDTAAELNVVEGTTVEEFYAVTADRNGSGFHRSVKPSIVQPTWNSSQRLGRGYKNPHFQAAVAGSEGEPPSPPSEEAEKMVLLAKAFRESRKPGSVGLGARVKMPGVSGRSASPPRDALW